MYTFVEHYHLFFLVGQQLPDARQCIVNTGTGYTWVGPGESLNPER